MAPAVAARLRWVSFNASGDCNRKRGLVRLCGRREGGSRTQVSVSGSNRHIRQERSPAAKEQNMYRCSGCIFVAGVKRRHLLPGARARVHRRKDNKWQCRRSLSLARQRRGGKKEEPNLRAMAVEATVVINTIREITSTGLIKRRSREP